MKYTFFSIALLVTLYTLQVAHGLPLSPGGSTHLPLEGEWRVATANLIPLAIGQRCQPVVGGTRFRFACAQLMVLTDTLSAPCASYRYTTTGNTISFIREDMVWLCSYRLSNDSLMLSSSNFFRSYTTQAPSSGTKPAALQEINVLLIKQNQ